LEAVKEVKIHLGGSNQWKRKLVQEFMKVAYLINQYPKISHSFIRREILALEELGVVVERISVRPIAQTDLADEADRRECQRTRALLGTGLIPLLGSGLFLAISRLSPWLKTLGLTIQVGRRSHRGLLRHFAYFLEACLLWRWLKAAGITHIHAHFGTNSTTVAMLCASLGDISYSFTVHGPEEFDRPEAIAIPEKISRACFVVAISSYGKSQLYRWCSLADWPKIQVVHCALAADYLQQEITPVPEVPQLVCVGRLCEQKGQLLLVQAVRQLRDNGIAVKLVLVGDGELRSPIEELIEQYQLEENITITGWASSAMVQQHLLASRAMVLPSFAEGLPVVIMEAFALGRPVISTYVAGIPELVKPGVSGWLVPPGSIPDLVEAMQSVLTMSCEQLTAMAAMGQQAVQMDHDVHKEAEKLAQHFHTYASAP
jgi:glycosyltransferase involved in cell wall biosynthesis